MARHPTDTPEFERLEALVPRAPGWRIDWDQIWPLWPDLRALDACTQDQVHHAEGDVGTHTRMVVGELVADRGWRGLRAAERSMLFWAAVLHDVGKPACTKQEPDGRITSRGHSRKGAAMARLRLFEAGAPFVWREGLCGIIANHQLPFWLIERPRPARLAVVTSLQCRPDLLCRHAVADALGRICADRQGIVDNVALAAEVFDEAGCLTGPYPFANDESRVAFCERDDRDLSYHAWEDFACEVTVMAGLPGAGKDTWLASNRPDLPVVSLDRIRAETGEGFSGNQGRVVQAAYEQAREHLRARRDFAWNATNVTRLTRQKVLGLLRDYGARIRIVYLEPPSRILRQQNAGREAAVPSAVLDRLVSTLEPPGPGEAHEVVAITEG